MRRLLKASYIIPAVVLLSATGINRYWRAPTPLQPVYPAYFGNDGRGLHLSTQEKKDLLAFLRMLTDSSFITDKRFSNPFVKK